MKPTSPFATIPDNLYTGLRADSAAHHELSGVADRDRCEKSAEECTYRMDRTGGSKTCARPFLSCLLAMARLATDRLLRVRSWRWTARPSASPAPRAGDTRRYARVCA